MADNKFYPAASEEMARMLGLVSEPAKAEPVQNTTFPEVVPVEASVIQMPVQTPEEIIAQDVAAITGEAPAKMMEQASATAAVVVAGSALQPALLRVGKVVLSLVPYLLVFVILFGVYYFWFADPSNRPEIFRKVQTKTPTVAEQKATDMATAQKEQKVEFNTWILQYYFDVSDAAIVAPDFIAPNKLTNFENYLLKLNPKTNDIRRLGVTDAESVLNGIEPNTGEPLADWQRDVVAKYFNSDAILARVRGETSTSAPSAVTPRVAQAATSTPNGVCAENAMGINTEIAGRLEVPSMGVNVPIIWTKNAANFDNDLKSGVVHYPCTPLPGDTGTSYISGHSSNYAWIKADFNQVFAQMNSLADGATFKITVVGNDGKDIRLHYIVQRKAVYAADDQAQFANTADSLVALSTCWPLNTTEKRMVAYGKLDRVEK